MTIEGGPAFEETVRSALSARAGDVSVDAGARAAIERGVVRARRRRAIGAGVLAVVLLAGGGVMTSSLLRDDDQGGLVTPGGEQTPSLSPTPSATPRAMTTYDDPRGFRIVYPSDYRRYYFEGDVVIWPTGLPSLEQGEPTFGISFRPEAGANDPMDCQGPDLAQPGTDSSRVVDGTEVATCEQTGDDGDNWYRRTYSFVWPDQPCDHPSMGCASDKGVTLTVRMVGGTKALWDQYLEDGTAIAESARATPPRPNEDAQEAAAAEPARTTLAGAREVVVGFMDARIAGSDAEGFMTPQARRAASAELYGYGDPPIDYTRYTITREEAADANSFVFGVDVTSADGAVGHEDLFVGSSDGGVGVRGIALTAREIP